MRLKFLYLLLLVGLGLSASAQIKSAEVLASGLTCSMCSKAIYKALERIPFIDTVKVNIETSTYLLSFKKDHQVQIEAIRDAVYDAGFAIAKMAIVLNLKESVAVKDAVFEQAGYSFKWQLQGNKAIISPQKVFIVNKDIQPVNGIYQLNF